MNIKKKMDAQAREAARFLLDNVVSQSKLEFDKDAVLEKAALLCFGSKAATNCVSPNFVKLAKFQFERDKLEYMQLMEAAEALATALEVYAMTNETFPEYGDVARETLEKFEDFKNEGRK